MQNSVALSSALVLLPLVPMIVGHQVPSVSPSISSLDITDAKLTNWPACRLLHSNKVK